MSGPASLEPPTTYVRYGAVLDRIRVNGAWQDRAEGWKGSLVPGMVADYCVLDGRILDIDLFGVCIVLGFRTSGTLHFAITAVGTLGAFTMLSLVDGGDTEQAYELFPELRERPGTRAGELSGGEQQMLVLARALIARPSCLLIDEISLGLAPRVVQRLARVIGEAARAGAAVLIVEQFTSVALAIADAVIVVVRGEIVLRERAEVLVRDPTVLERAYMGFDSRDAQE